ncbi:MAG: DNA repair protein RecN, partial [Bacteroidales bacterium]
KFACASVAELKQVREKFSQALFDSSSLVEEKAELDKEIDEVSGKLEGTAKRLHESRHKASGTFASAIEKTIRFLELDRAVFQVSLYPQDISSTGIDEAEFLFSSSGHNPVDVSRCASGGELSRIMLCLKAMMAKYASMPTMIFDEIDTGVSGSVADKMGSMICAMGKDMQVFAITHLPQVAAKGMAHYLVTKSFDGGKAVSSIRRLSEEERISEIARMLSGSVVTPEAIANAKSLLSD